jgi:hypothetical protein
MDSEKPGAVKLKARTCPQYGRVRAEKVAEEAVEAFGVWAETETSS